MINLDNIFTIQEVTSSPSLSIDSSVNSRKKRISNAIRNMKKPNLQTLFSVESSYEAQQSISPALPKPWSINDSVLSDQTNNTHLIVDQTNVKRKGQIRMYSNSADRSSRLRVERHRLALKKLSNIQGIPKLIDCNHKKPSITINSWENLWPITERPEGMRLDDYLSTQQPSFKDKLLIILKLIDLIKDVHQCDVVHRNLTPSKIYIELLETDDEQDEFHLQLIDFEFAYVPSTRTQTNNNTNIHKVNDPVMNNFYLPIQFQIIPLNINDIDEENEQNQK